MKPKRTLTLYHFTCHHGHEAIQASHTLLPSGHPFMPALGPLLWLTDLAAPPSRESLGLTSMIARCDRLAYRYVVKAPGAVVHWSTIRERAPRNVVADMEAFGSPEHWWVARRPLLASEFEIDNTWSCADLLLDVADGLGSEVRP